MNKAREELDALIEQLEQELDEIGSVQAELQRIVTKRDSLASRLSELRAIRHAHDKKNIDIVQAKLSGQYAQPFQLRFNSVTTTTMSSDGTTTTITTVTKG